MPINGSTATYTIKSGTHQAYARGGIWWYTHKGVERACGKTNRITKVRLPIQPTSSNDVTTKPVLNDDDNHTDNKCSICLDNVQFPMSNGCCSFKFCKSCFDQMPHEQKIKCGGCRQPTVFTGSSDRVTHMVNSRLKQQLMDTRRELREANEELEEANEQLESARVERDEARDERDEAIDETNDLQIKFNKLEKERDQYAIKIKKNNELAKFNDNMIYMTIILLIFQYLF